MYLPQPIFRGKLCTCHDTINEVTTNCYNKLTFVANNVLATKSRSWQLRHTQQNYNVAKPLYCYAIVVACMISYYHKKHGKWSNCHAHERCMKILLPCLATDNTGCKKPKHLQRQTRNSGNILLPHDILQPLATNVVWWHQLPFATKLGLSQSFFGVA